ncbi:hypothetical protein [Kitasatospora sp. LaBMicrA B282]|uniref:hypothetical protein n=1 Tax=Kitasatospora sp. LaBMicrA B282 TaxID=3420949 RepID=UPI003D0C5261
MGGTVTTRQIRMLRAVVFATLCVALAAAAHVSMSGAVAPGPVLAGAFAATVGATWLLAGQRRGAVVIGGWMVCLQAALHLLFEATARVPAGPVQGLRGTPDWVNLLLCTPGGANPPGMTPSQLAVMAGMDPGTLSSGTMPGMSGMAGMSGMGGGHVVAGLDWGPSVAGMSLGMLAAHLLAALACALLLWRGESALVGLFEALRALAGAVLPVFVLLVLSPLDGEAPARVRRRPTRTRLPRLVALSHAVVRRGPPLLALTS